MIEDNTVIQFYRCYFLCLNPDSLHEKGAFRIAMRLVLQPFVARITDGSIFKETAA